MADYNGWTVQKLIEFEREIADEFEQGHIHAPIHLAGGNEQNLIDIFSDGNIGDKNTWCFGTHRSHYHALLKGIPPELVKREIMAGHSINLQFPEYHFFTSAIVGGICPIALGVAMTGQKCWVFIGDMGSRTGIFDECQRYVQSHSLPITFVVEDNSMSVDTPTKIPWGRSIGRTAPHVKVYQYQRTYPHQGTNKGWVTF